LPVRAQITVSAGTLGAATGTSDATAAPPAGTAANDVAIVYCWARNSGDTTTVSGYTEIPSTHVNTSNGSHRWFWLRLSGAASTATCDHNTSSDNYARMFVFRGLVTSGNPWDAVNAGVSRTPDSNGEYISGITAGAQSMVVVFSGYEDNDEANIACTSTDPATYTASYAEKSTGSGGAINACYAIKSSAGATGDILVNYGNVAGSNEAGRLAISLTHACSGPTIGAHTVCGATTYDNPSPAAFVSATYTPAVGNGVLLLLTWGGGSDPLNESITSIVNQDGTSLGCFVASPGSTFKLYSGPGTDEEAWAFYYCPAIPSSPSITAIRTNLSASTAYLQEFVVEFSAGTIQTTDFWDTDNTAVSRAEELEASVSVTNTHANDLLIAFLHNGLPTYPKGGYPPVTADSNYTAIVANPAYQANDMLEARAVSSTGSQTATITWSGTSLQWFGGIVGLKAVDSGSVQATHFAVSTPATATAGTAFNFTVTAKDAFNNTVTGYAGTVHFTSTDSQPVLPANTTLTSGTGTFPATLKTRGSQTITATDTGNATITGTSNAITSQQHTVGGTSVSPRTAIVGQPSIATVSVSIPDPAVIAGGANLLRLDSSGNATIVGVLHDDGKNGDAVAGDGVFTYQVTLNESSIGQINFQVSAAFRGSLRRVRADVEPVFVQAPNASTVAIAGLAAELASGNISAALLRFLDSDRASAALSNLTTAGQQRLANAFAAAQLVSSNGDQRVYQLPWIAPNGTILGLEVALQPNSDGNWVIVSW